MRRHGVGLLLGLAALLLTPGAAGVPNVPGDPTPPVVTPVITGTLGDAAWYRSNVTVGWTVVDPESIILSTTGCDTRTLTDDTAGIRLTCMAESDGGETTVTKTIKLDKTAPTASATPSRPADANGWYNHELTVGFAGNDAMSGLDSCSAARSYEGPDTPSTSVSGTCRDRAGNTAPAAFALKYDETSPQASPAARLPDANGWYNHAVVVTFQGADGTSGVQSCTEVTYDGPDDSSAALSGTCVDRAGNQSASIGFTLKYDETAPQASATTSRAPDVNGWYNDPLTVSFAGSDVTSGLDSCDAPKSYSGPDSAAASVSGSCRDLAGNAAPRSVALKYDATAPQTAASPSRQPNASGWYSAPLSVSFTGTDAVSGNVSCAAAKSYSGPDAASATVSGTCTDNAGNVGAGSLAVKYDATAPQAAATPSRQPNANGWYRAPLTVSFAGTDATSGIDSCDAAKSYSGPDAASASLSGTCRDRAGNSSGSSLALKYDGTAPTVTAAPARAANASGWYNAAVAVSFTGADVMSGLDSCDAAKTYSGPDSATASVGGNCFDKAGNTGSAALPLMYDATAPQTTAIPSRQPNANGWYNAALTVSFAAIDATSTVESCDAAKSYSGPDGASATVAGACRDKAGNAGAASLPLKYDATAPQASAAPSRPPNANGWYNAPLTVSFAAIDATSSVDSCDAPKAYSGPESSSTAVTGACRDTAGNTGVASMPLKYDATGPQASATPSRQPNASGWYNAPLAVTFAGSDALSGLDSCPSPKGYGGPDAASAVVSGSCVDKAGNGTLASFALKYDATAPAATAAPARQPNEHGWYNAPLTVTFAAGDPLSGLDSCPAAKSYEGPDAVSAVISGTCFDKAGNGALASLAVKYDATAPQTTATASRKPNGNEWYNAPLTVTFAADDATSGPESCTAPQSYSGPDSAEASRSGSCRDRAGNASSDSLSFKYDSTPPEMASAVPARAPDRAGWYNRPVIVDARGSDATSGLASCPAVTYAGPDGNDAPVAGTCVDRAGNVGFKWFSIDYDSTGPHATAAASRAPDANGWYNAAVAVSFAGSDSVSGVDSCAAPERYEGPDTASAVVSGICVDNAGNPGVASYPLHYDATPPQVTGATPERAPDAAGWYNRPLAVSFHGSDSTSGVDACTHASYGGPDVPAATVSGSCRDRAGNGSSAASFALRYDATAPRVAGVVAKGGNRTVTLRWTASPDTALVELRRQGRLVYRGTGTRFTDSGLENGKRYGYTLTGFDEAGNAATASAAAIPAAPLISPAAGAKVTAPPRLVWTAVPKARYYHVQLWRGGRILSTWPSGTSVRLSRMWTYAGRRYRLTPGRYRWFVWPGFGRRAEKRFGPLLGSSSFVVR